MTLSDEEYMRIDAEYAAKREPFDSRVEHYSLLEKVIDGKATFENRALEFSRGFMDALQKRGLFREAFEGPSLKKTASWVDVYMKCLMSYIHMVEDLYPVHIPIAEQAFRDFLTGKRRMKTEDWPGTNEVFDHLCAASKMLDRKVRKLYAPRLFQNNPRLFREVYADMSLEERAYTEHRVYKMLGAGIFSKAGIDEITVQRMLHEPLVQSQFDTYIDNVVGYVMSGKVKDRLTLREHPPSESFMRSVEERLEPPDSDDERCRFRAQILCQILESWGRGKTFDYTCHERLCRAVEKKIEDIPALRKRR